MDERDYVKEIFPSLPPVPEHKVLTDAEKIDEIKRIAESLSIETEKKQPEIPKKRKDLLFSEGEELRRNEKAQMNERRCTDLGNAERIIDQFSPYIKYCHESESWYIWNSIEGRWKQDNKERIMQISLDVTRRLLIESARAATDQNRKDLARWAFECENKTHQRGMIDLARTFPAIHVDLDQLDSDDYLINMSNGTFNLKTYELQNHKKEDFISKTVGYNYDPAAKCPMWLAFLDRIFRSRKDKDQIIAFIQRAAGYTLTGVTAEEILLMCWGSGKNGKTVMLEVLRGVMGEYATVTEGATFIQSKYADASRPRNDIARLAGSRMVCASENASETHLDEVMIKKLTSCEDRISARFLNKEYFEFKPKFKIWWIFNHQPQITDQTFSIWRRIKMIPFEETIPEEERDKGLADKLKKELPGIFNWVVEGLKQYNKIGLNEPECVTKTTNEYKDQQDILGDFFSYGIEIGKGKEVKASDLYQAYVQYNNMENTNERPMSSTKFGKILVDKGYKREKKTSGNYYIGLCVKRVVYK